MALRAVPVNGGTKRSHMKIPAGFRMCVWFSLDNGDMCGKKLDSWLVSGTCSVRTLPGQKKQNKQKNNNNRQTVSLQMLHHSRSRSVVFFTNATGCTSVTLATKHGTFLCGQKTPNVRGETGSAAAVGWRRRGGGGGGGSVPCVRR